MIDELKEILKSEAFKTWLDNPQIWETMDVDYHPPRVERVWMPVNDKRISLHVIHPCEDGDALVHGHPWESAMYVLPIGGVYEHGVGCKIQVPMSDKYVDEIVCTQQFRGDVYYEMLSPDGIHYVRPIGIPVYSIMLSGPVVYEFNKTEVNKELKPLSDERKIEILETFKAYFE